MRYIMQQVVHRHDCVGVLSPKHAMVDFEQTLIDLTCSREVPLILKDVGTEVYGAMGIRMFLASYARLLQPQGQYPHRPIAHRIHFQRL